MNLKRYGNVEEFYDHTREFLLQHEAEHNLMLGLLTQTLGSAQPLGHDLYLASMTSGGTLTAVAVRTPPYSVVLSRCRPDAILLLAGDIHTVYPVLPGVLGPLEETRQFAEAWQRLSRQVTEPGISQRIYQLNHVVPVSGVPGRMRLATETDREWLVAWSNAFCLEAYAARRSEVWTLEASRQVIDGYLTSATRGMYVWEHDGPVSIAAFAGPTPNGIRVSHVYTPPELRGQGYASAIVAALSQHLLDTGCRYCFLYTDLSNPTSNKIYQRIGYQAVADVDEWLFGHPGS